MSPRCVQDHAAAVGGDSGDRRSDAGLRRSLAAGGLRQPPGRHHKGLDQSETKQQDSRARLAGQRQHVDQFVAAVFVPGSRLFCVLTSSPRTRRPHRVQVYF